jgi:hypothetical protein
MTENKQTQYRIFRVPGTIIIQKLNDETGKFRAVGNISKFMCKMENLDANDDNALIADFTTNPKNKWME